MLIKLWTHLAVHKRQFCSVSTLAECWVFRIFLNYLQHAGLSKIDQSGSLCARIPWSSQNSAKLKKCSAYLRILKSEILRISHKSWIWSNLFGSKTVEINWNFRYTPKNILYWKISCDSSNLGFERSVRVVSTWFTPPRAFTDYSKLRLFVIIRQN